jgi:hypothetical protein
MNTLLGQDERKSGVRRVTAADVIPAANLKTPPLQSFEEPGIAPSFRAAVEKELTEGEKMLWLGRPSRNPQVHPRNPVLLIGGVGLIGLGVVVAAVAIFARVGPFPFVFAGFLGVLGLVFLLPTLLGPKAMPACYVVTNRRAIIVEMSMFNRGPRPKSYLPHQLLGLERKDHATVAGAGDLIFEYAFALPGQTVDLKTGSFLPQGAGVGLSNAPARVPHGFLLLDQVREVEHLIRTTLLGQLEQALDECPPTPANGVGHESEPDEVSIVCACGATVLAPAALAGQAVKCPQCAAPISIPANGGAAARPGSYREDGPIAADLKAKTLAGLDPNEKLVWIGQPVPKLIFVRGSAPLVGGVVVALVALIWLLLVLAPPKADAGKQVQAPQQPGKKASGAKKEQQPATPAARTNEKSTVLLPVGLFLISGCFAAVPLVRVRTARRTCYALTNRRALVYKEGWFGPTRDSYPPLEVAGMQPRHSWIFKGSGDLIFRTVKVISTSSSRGRWTQSVKTKHYGFLAIAQIHDIEKLVRETLIDRFVDKLNQASSL